MSYVDTEKGTSLVCDHKGCKNRTTGKNHTEAWKKAKAEGWLMRTNTDQICPTHRAEHSARASKAAKPAAGKVAKKGGKAKTLKRSIKPGGVISFSNKE